MRSETIYCDLPSEKSKLCPREGVTLGKACFCRNDRKKKKILALKYCNVPTFLKNTSTTFSSWGSNTLSSTSLEGSEVYKILDMSVNKTLQSGYLKKLLFSSSLGLDLIPFISNFITFISCPSKSKGNYINKDKNKLDLNIILVGGN